MDYSLYELSANSERIPEIGECDRCPFVNKCKDGEKCLVRKDRKHRDKKSYYQQNREKILAYQKLVRDLRRV